MDVTELRKEILKEAKDVELYQREHERISVLEIQPEGILQSRFEEIVHDWLPHEWDIMKTDDQTWTLYEKIGKADDGLTKRDIIATHPDGSLTTIIVLPDEQCGEVQTIKREHLDEVELTYEINV